MSEPIKIVVTTAGTQQAAAELQALTTSTSAGLQQVAKHADSAAASFSNNRMAFMEMGHSARAMADGFAAGMSPMRLMLMESPRLMQSFAEASAELRASIMGFLPVVGAIAAGVGVGVLAWKGMRSEYERVIERGNDLTQTMLKQAEAIKTVAMAAKGGAISQDSRDLLLKQLGLNMSNGASMALPPINPASFLPPQQNAQNIVSGPQHTMSMKGLGIPDAAALDHVNAELAKMGVLLKTIDPATRNVSYTLNPEIQSLAELTSMREKYESQVELNFDKQRARAQKQHDEALRDLDVEIAKAKQYRDELTLSLVHEHDPQARAGIQSVVAGMSDEKLNESRLVLEQQYRDKLADITAKEQAKREQQSEAAARKQAEAENKIRVENAKDVADQIKVLEGQITSDQNAEGGKREQFYLREYTERFALYTKLLVQGKMSEDEYDEKTAEAQKKALEQQRTYNAELQKEVDLRRAIARGEAEAQLDKIKGNPFLTDQQKAAQSVQPIQNLMVDNQKAMAGYQNTMDTSPDGNTRLEAQLKLVDAMKQQVQLQTQLNAAQGQNSFAYQMLSVITKLQNAGGSLQQQMADVFGSAMQGGINSVSKGITGLIEGTTTWRQAILQISRATIGELIQGFVHMAVEWVAKNTIMLAATKLLHLMDGTLTTTTETEKTAAVVTGSATRKVAAISEAEAWLASAAMSAAGSVASIPYVGWALAIAAMADVEGTGQGIIATAALAGFMSGGYSGDIPTNQIAGVVHGQEFIFDAAATSRIGPENLEAMRRGEYRPSSVQSSSGSGSADGGVDIKHVVVYDRQSFLNELKSSDARRVMVTHLNHPETKARLGIRT